MPLATAVLCMEFPQTTSPGSHGQHRKDFSTKDDGDRTALILSHACRNYITFCLSLTLCGQLGSSNQSALLILSYQELVTYTFTLASL